VDGRLSAAAIAAAVASIDDVRVTNAAWPSSPELRRRGGDGTGGDVSTAAGAGAAAAATSAAASAATSVAAAAAGAAVSSAAGTEAVGGVAGRSSGGGHLGDADLGEADLGDAGDAELFGEAAASSDARRARIPPSEGTRSEESSAAFSACRRCAHASSPGLGASPISLTA
jgi:hypothetical protein